MNRAEYSVGFRFAETISIPSTDIKSFASLVGDINPIHHDLSEATRRGHDGLIACGPHIASLLAALLTIHRADSRKISSDERPIIALA
jgi:acyl dehydratase